MISTGTTPAIAPVGGASAGRTMRIGLIGLDTSHVEAFAAILNDAKHFAHPSAARITAAFPAGSEDFPLSRNRVDGFTRNLRDNYGVAIMSSAGAVAEAVDAIMITSVDGRVHPEQFAEIATAGKPVFVDKPFAVSARDARRIVEIAAQRGTRFFSCSNLRFSGALQEALADPSLGVLHQADFFGPLRFEPLQPGYFWYGIHPMEMLYATLGTGCLSVQVQRDRGEIITGTWRDGRQGVVRLGEATNRFGGRLRGSRGERVIDVAAGLDPIIGLTRAALAFFRGGSVPVPVEQTLELVRFIEAANESREKAGRSIFL